MRESRYLTTDGIGVYADARKRLQHERGFRVVLTGMGGDDWFTGADNPYPDLLGKLRLRTALSEFGNDVRDLGRNGAARLLLRGAAQTVWPFSRASRGEGPTPGPVAVADEGVPHSDRPRTIACTPCMPAARFPSNAQRERFWFLGERLAAARRAR